MTESKYTESIKTLIKKTNPHTAALGGSIKWENKIMFDHCNKEILSLKKVLICDCDGILTDGNLGYTKSGKIYKTYGCHDHEMINLLTVMGWEIIFVTNDKDGMAITKERVKDMGCQVLSASPKVREDMVKTFSKQGYIVAFFGDSPSDLPAAMLADYRYTTANCFEPIKEYFHFVSKSKGGHGGFAECCYELIYKLHEAAMGMKFYNMGL